MCIFQLKQISAAALVSIALVSVSGCTEEADSQAESADSQAGDIDSRSEKIVGGWDANIADHPWQVSFQTFDGFHFCGGSILNASWILTAQHCVNEGTNIVTSPATLRIGAGSSTLSAMEAEGQIRNIDEIIPYPGYSDPSLGKDVALLHLSTPLTLDANAAAISLVDATDEANGLLDPGVPSTVSGWGSLSFEGASPDMLQAVSIPIVSLDDANEAYEMTLTSDQLPAGDMVDGGEDSCQGDSGGPLTIIDGETALLAGVVSWGEGCADVEYPGLYARVSSFEPWIGDMLTRNIVTRRSTSNVGVRKRGWLHYAVSVPSAVKALNAHLSGGTGDGDLYVRMGSRPTLTSYTCRPYADGNDESCSIPNASKGTWYVSIYGYSAVSGATLRVTTI